MNEVRGLTLTQPWASLVASGHKRFETRSWRTSYRGVLLIHAAKGFPPEARAFAAEERALGRIPERIPRAAVVAVACLTDVRPVEQVAPFVSGLERHLGDYSPDRYAWQLEDVRSLEEPVPWSGALGLWRPSEGDLTALPMWFGSYRAAPHSPTEGAQDG